MYNHLKYDIENKLDLLDLIQLFKKEKVKQVIAFDTETTGLNIKLDKPFLYQAGFVVGSTIVTYVVDIEKNPELAKQVILATHEMAKKCEYFIGHNIKYDLQMLANIGIEYEGDNVLDTQICIRLAHDALTQANGGPPLGLKEYATQYIKRDAKLHEHALSAERTSIAKGYNLDLIGKLRKFPNPPIGYKSWTKGALEEIFKDVTSTYKDLPEDMQYVYEEWFNNIPDNITSRMTTPFVQSKDIPYNILNREAVKSYGHMDIYYTLMVFLKTMPVIKTRKNDIALKIEQECIKPLWAMERVGFQINKQYVLESKERMYNYIKQRRADVVRLVGYPVAVGQNAVIKDILINTFKLNIKSTGADELDQLVSKLKHENNASGVVEFIEVMQELRTLEKWYSTYLLRFINEMRNTDRTYTQINQVGTVSGRVTSDFQQFPKYGILDKAGNELFNPRQMVVLSKPEGYVGLGYLDYSQIELRLQAMYTILVGHPDLNLCRAYMPYECTHEGVVFDYNNPEHIKNAYTWEWLRNEDQQPWTPTDVHAATTHVAFPELDTHSDEFKKLRGKVGKRVNFAKNYGAQFNRIKQMFPDYDDETIHKIDDAYYKAFPGVKAYHQYCYELANQCSYATNLFGVRYYGLTGHKLINTLIQGSGAYFLKLKMIQVHNYLKENNYKSRYQMNIHDEMSFEIYKGEEHILYDIQKIMQVFDDTLVPIVADMEVSTTTWAEKKEVEDLEDVKRLLYSEVETSKS
jgi:DNA polymerase I